MTILSRYLRRAKEVKNENIYSLSTECKDSTKESKESVVKGMNQAPTSLVGNEKPNVVCSYASKSN